jgi:hypothetical protein
MPDISEEVRVNGRYERERLRLQESVAILNRAIRALETNASRPWTPRIYRRIEDLRSRRGDFRMSIDDLDSEYHFGDDL